MGPAPLGFAYFVGVKFVGYTAAAFAMRKVAYPNFGGSVIKVGGARTLVGVVAGTAYGALWFFLLTKVFRNADQNEIYYFAALLPVRIGEWLWLVHLFFDKGLIDRRKAFRLVAGGSVWSYCLDAIGIGAAFVIPGGIWVC